MKESENPSTRDHQPGDSWTGSSGSRGDGTPWRPRRHKSSEIRAAFLVGLFTLGGVVLGAGLERCGQASVRSEIERREIVSLVARRAQGRYFRASNLFQVRGSSKFSSRWDDYIEHGVYPWNEDLSIIELGIERHFPDSVDSLKELQRDFAELSRALQVFHQRQGSPPAEDVRTAEDCLEEARLSLRTLLGELTD